MVARLAGALLACLLLVGCPPPREEQCGDLLDNDVDGLVDCDDPDCEAREVCPEEWVGTGDEDGDGHGALEAGGDDCDDHDPSVHPGAPELCDGVDNDCDEATGEEGAVTLDGSQAFASLQQAVQAAGEGATITLCQGSHTGSFVIERSLTLEAFYSAGETTLQGDGDGSVLELRDGTHRLDGLHITGGNGTICESCGGQRIGGGLLITTDNIVTIDRCVISNNQADLGAGMYIDTGGNVVMGYSGMASNTASDKGGAIYLTDATLELEAVTISANNANWGGGLACLASTVQTESSYIEYNNTVEAGGGLFVYASEIAMDGGRVVENTAAYGGGAVLFADDDHPLQLDSHGVDWGADSSGNTPEDLWIDGVGYYDADDLGKIFVCDEEGCQSGEDATP